MTMTDGCSLTSCLMVLLDIVVSIGLCGVAHNKLGGFITLPKSRLKMGENRGSGDNQKEGF